LYLFLTSVTIDLTYIWNQFPDKMGTTQGFSYADEFIGWETIPTVPKPEVVPRLYLEWRLVGDCLIL